MEDGGCPEASRSFNERHLYGRRTQAGDVKTAEKLLSGSGSLRIKVEKIGSR